MVLDLSLQVAEPGLGIHLREEAIMRRHCEEVGNVAQTRNGVIGGGIHRGGFLVLEKTSLSDCSLFGHVATSKGNVLVGNAFVAWGGFG